MSLVLLCSSFLALCLDLFFLFNTCKEHRHAAVGVQQDFNLEARKSRVIYIMFELLQVVYFELHSIFVVAVSNPLQHHDIGL